MSFPWLTVLLLVPAVGAAAVMAVPKRPAGTTLPKQVAFVTSLVALALAIAVAVQFDPGAGYQFSVQHVWIAAFGAHYALGVNGVGLTLVLLTTILTPVVILASWNDGEVGRWSVNSFFAWMLFLESLALGVFMATDVFLFYVLFEATLIPIYFLIGGFGGAKRSYAAVKFLLYSLLGGLLMLASVVGLYVVSAGTGNGPSYLLSDLMELPIDQDVARWLFLGFFVAFAIKAPMFPLHTWLPDATSEGTAGTSVLLVSILDKIGTFGMLRFCLGIFPGASEWATPVVLALAVTSVIYGGIAAIGQNDIRRLIGYTSVSHFGFIVMGIFVLNSQGMSGSTLYMFNHGIATAGLFLVTGFFIHRRQSKYISDFGGVEKVAPLTAGLFLLLGLASLSLPGLAPFVSEIMVLVGTFSHNWIYAAFAVVGIVLAAMYILWMYQRTMTGPPTSAVSKMTDLNLREVVSLAPVVVLLVVLGFYPQPLLNVINPAVQDTMEHVQVSDPQPLVPGNQTASEDEGARR